MSANGEPVADSFRRAATGTIEEATARRRRRERGWRRWRQQRRRRQRRWRELAAIHSLLLSQRMGQEEIPGLGHVRMWLYSVRVPLFTASSRNAMSLLINCNVVP